MHLLGRMILHVKFNTCGLPCDENSANHPTLNPKLAVLTNDDPFWFLPRKFLLETLDDIDFFLICDESSVTVPGYTNASTSFVAYVR